MAGLTSEQIVARACAIAKVPGWTQQGGQYLNVVLQDLAQTYDFEVTRKTWYFTMDPGLAADQGMSIYGSGPYDMPADFLRFENSESVIYSIGDGVPRMLIACDLTQFDQLVQQAGNQSYPYIMAVDMSSVDAEQQGDATPGPQAYIWPPPSGAYTGQGRYFPQMPDIDTPETSSDVPWFPNQTYLITRVAGELMKEADDERWRSFLGETPEGAQGILNRYLKLKDNSSNRAKRVTLDKRSFGGANFQNLPNTKTLGW